MKHKLKIEDPRTQEEAIENGIDWLDKNVPHWRKKIGTTPFNKETMAGVHSCVLGRVDGWDAMKYDLRPLGFNPFANSDFGASALAWNKALGLKEAV